MTSPGLMLPEHPSVIVEPSGELTAAPHQISVLNTQLPRGFRFEPSEKAQKAKALNKAGKRKKPVVFRNSVI